MTIKNLSTNAIVIALLNDSYYETVAWGFLEEAVETAKKESGATTIEGLNSYIKENLI